MTYAGAHYRVKRDNGKASGYACVTCAGQAEHWALINDRGDRVNGKGQRWSNNPVDYRAMCVGCHSEYDAGWHKAQAVLAEIRAEAVRVKARERWHRLYSPAASLVAA